MVNGCLKTVSRLAIEMLVLKDYNWQAVLRIFANQTAFQQGEGPSRGKFREVSLTALVSSAGCGDQAEHSGP